MMLSAIAAVLLLDGPGAARAQEAVTSKYKTTFYGQIKTDVVYDEHGVAENDYAQYVTSKNDNDRDFRLSARGSRLGFDLKDADKISGKMEMDFIGVTDGAAATAPRLRHAYVNIKSGKTDMLVGQTWHLLPMELPGSNNDFLLGYSGALYSRAPQVRVSYKYDDRWNYAAAVVRPTRKLTDSEGTASGFPQFQAQAQLRHGKAKFTLAGVIGQWRNTTAGQTTSGRRGDVTLVDFGYNIPLNGKLTLNGQLWTGRNLYDFLGGIGNMGYGSDEVKATGGFANLNIKPAGKAYYNVAVGIDDPVNAKIAASATSRTRNTTLLANANCLAYEKVTVSFEIARQITEYRLTTGYKNLYNMHYQTSFKFPF